jgi:hypothetical protein
MTGYWRNAVVHNGRLDQGVNTIEKPFTQAALAAKIRNPLDGLRCRLRRAGQRTSTSTVCRLGGLATTATLNWVRTERGRLCHD